MKTLGQPLDGYRTSSFCPPGCAAGDCVAIRFQPSGKVLLKDTKDPTAPPLSFSRREWQAFIAGVKNHEFEIN